MVPSFLTLALAVGKWLASHPGRFTPGQKSPGNHWIGGWVGSSIGLNIADQRKISCSYWESNPDSSTCMFIHVR
jgi:hypothetical protein